MDYDLLKTVHIVFATLFFGGGTVSAFFKFRTRNVTDLNTLKYVHENIVVADYLFTLPSVIGLPLTGFWMLDFGALNELDSWVILGVLLYLVAVIFWIPAAYLQIKMKNSIIESIKNESNIEYNYYKYSKAWFFLGIPSALASILIFYVMVSKSNPIF